MMNGLVMMLLAVVVLGGAYLIYGRYLAKKWGVDPDAKTPAYEMEDGCLLYTSGGQETLMNGAVYREPDCRPISAPWAGYLLRETIHGGFLHGCPMRHLHSSLICH